MPSILDKRFKYTNSVSTDIRKTFAKARKELERKRLVDEVLAHPKTENVAQLSAKRVRS